MCNNISKTACLSAIILALLLITGCGGRKQQFTYKEMGESFFPMQNNTLFGICDKGSDDSTLMLINDVGDTLTLSTADALRKGTVMGGYRAGEHIAVQLSSDSASVLSCINTTELLGVWLMPDPYDGSTIIGINIKDGGDVDGIEQSNVIYKSWQIIDGQLELTFVREGGIEEDETAAYTIRKLDRDSLVFENEEDIYEYGRGRNYR